MDDKKYFTAQMDKLLKFGRENSNCVTEKDVKEYFKEISLTDEQLQLIYNFLYDSKIGLNEPFDTEDVLDEEDRDFLQMYIDELSLLEKVSDEDKYSCIEKYLSGNESLKEKVIEIYLPEVVEMSKLYAGDGVPIEDLIGEGNVALSVSVNDLSKKLSPKEADGFITDSVMSAMEELLYEDNGERQKANTWAEDANEVLEKAKELAQTLGRNVKVDELCKFGDFEEDFVNEVLKITGGIEIIEG